MYGQRPDVKDWERLPCGCRIGTATEGGEPAFVMEPCSLTCGYYQYAISESNRQGKPMEHRVVDDER